MNRPAEDEADRLGPTISREEVLEGLRDFRTAYFKARTRDDRGAMDVEGLRGELLDRAIAFLEISPPVEAATTELADALEELLLVPVHPRVAIAGLPAVQRAEAALAKAGRTLAVMACLAFLAFATACASAPPRDPCAEPCDETERPCILYQGQCHPFQEVGP